VFFKKDRSPTFVYMPTCMDTSAIESIEYALILSSGCGCIINERDFFRMASEWPYGETEFDFNDIAYKEIVKIKKHVRQTKKKKS